jgi:hypothetical protein
MANTMQSDTRALFRSEVNGHAIYSGDRLGNGTGENMIVVIADPEAEDEAIAVTKGIIGDRTLVPDGTSTTAAGDRLHHLANGEGERVFSCRFETSSNQVRWARVRPFSNTLTAEARRQLKALGIV